jgi:hypothetical protein
MSLNLNEEQKSPKRRFLLLGIIRLVCVVVVGVLIMFWNKIDLNLSETQKVIIGVLFIGLWGVTILFFLQKCARSII